MICIQPGGGCLGRRGKRTVRIKVQRRSKHDRSRTQRPVIVGERGKVEYVSRRRNGARSQLSERVSLNIVDKRGGSPGWRRVRFRIGGHRLESDKAAIAAQPAAKQEAVSSAEYVTTRI